MIPAKRLITKANPLVTDRFVVYEGDTIKTQVSLVVWLIDEFTKKLPFSDITVRLKEVDKKPIKNPSGYYCFTDLDNGEYTIVVTPDSVRSDWYFKTEVSVTVPMPNKLEPVQEIILKPKLSYPYPSHMTLIRGFVVETSNEKTKPLPNISVYRLKVDNEKGVETSTNSDGEFALYIKTFTRRAEKHGMEVSIEADNAGTKERRELCILKEGTTVTMNVEFIA